MTGCLNRCGVTGLQRSLCVSAARLQDAAETTATPAGSSREFRSALATCDVIMTCLTLKLSKYFVPSCDFLTCASFLVISLHCPVRTVHWDGKERSLKSCQLLTLKPHIISKYCGGPNITATLAAASKRHERKNTYSKQHIWQLRKSLTSRSE